MSDAVMTALISGGMSVIAVVITAISTNRKAMAETEKSQAVTDAKIEELTREVREHNNFAHRIPVLENKISVADHRINDLEMELKKK